jgi:hypothetical protein
VLRHGSSGSEGLARTSEAGGAAAAAGAEEELDAGREGVSAAAAIQRLAAAIVAARIRWWSFAVMRVSSARLCVSEERRTLALDLRSGYWKNPNPHSVLSRFIDGDENPFMKP